MRVQLIGGESVEGDGGAFEGVRHVAAKSNGDLVLRFSGSKTRVSGDEFLAYNVVQER